MITIDLLVRYFLLPVLKYPILLLVPFQDVFPTSIMYLSIFYSVSIFGFEMVNSAYERKLLNTEKWLDYDQLDSPVAIITGGSNGLGKSIITTLLSKSERLTIINIDIQNSDSLNSSQVIFQQCDLSDALKVEMLLKKLKSLYQDNICLIINNAGMRSTYSSFDHISNDEFQKVMQTNCHTPFRIMQELRPKSSTVLHQCYIVNIASTLGILSPAKISVYAASKAALISIHNSLTFELNTQEKCNTRTLLVITGQLNTRMFNGFIAPRQFFAPVVNSEQLANKIVAHAIQGKSTVINEPFYANFAYLLMSMPSSIQAIARKFAQMDTCLPDEKTDNDTAKKTMIYHNNNGE